jgi:anti-anti-sigma factor
MQKNISLSGELTIYQARDTHSQLTDVLHDATELNLDLSNITDVDSSFLQILLWLQQEGVRQNIKVTLTQPSEVLQKVISQLGLAKSFNFGGSYEH